MDQRREPARRTFASRRGLEGEIVDRSDVGGMGETSNMRSVTAPTPEQMRALADEHETERNRLLTPRYGTLPPREEQVKHAGWHDRTAVALRAAADQLEAVRQYVTDGEVEDDNGQHVVYTYGLAPLLGLTAAPQSDRIEDVMQRNWDRRYGSDTSPQGDRYE